MIALKERIENGSVNKWVDFDFLVWFEKNVRFDPGEELPLEELYGSYWNFTRHSNNRVPITKKAFSIGLRSIFSGVDDSGAVRFSKKGRVVVQGLRIIESQTVFETL